MRNGTLANKIILSLVVSSTLFGGMAAAAPAANTPGEGLGVAVGSSSRAPLASNVAVGQKATVSGNVDKVETGDIALGDNATVVGTRGLSAASPSDTRRISVTPTVPKARPAMWPSAILHG